MCSIVCQSTGTWIARLVRLQALINQSGRCFGFDLELLCYKTMVLKGRRYTLLKQCHGDLIPKYDGEDEEDEEVGRFREGKDQMF